MTRPSRIALAAICSVAASSCNEPSDDGWVVVYGLQQVNFEVDADSIRENESGHKLAWTRSVLTDDSNRVGSIILHEYDCRGGRIRQLRSVYYPKGGSPEHEAHADADWSFVTPDSNGELRFDYVCS